MVLKREEWAALPQATLKIDSDRLNNSQYDMEISNVKRPLSISKGQYQWQQAIVNV